MASPDLVAGTPGIVTLAGRTLSDSVTALYPVAYAVAAAPESVVMESDA
ncbi:hypothetical protein J2Z69_001150 [Paenibacillus shirakamiensis]|uniref:Uncharacterized protein n=1 Tax=Paenibacillus shirakamiensis TaxID=1265935 RepID=A0ABS4JGA8_9BACL|nr:hypothetical protein [Paenibacillus shirakamiensis]